jgi:hypothetical protein
MNTSAPEPFAIIRVVTAGGDARAPGYKKMGKSYSAILGFI